MVMEFINGKVEHDTKDNIKMIKDKVLDK